jgi:primase-polymerase (primpol)-like protein
MSNIHEFPQPLPAKEILAAIPPEIRGLKQYVNWSWKPDPDGGKPTKRIVQCANAVLARSTEPRDWSSLDFALDQLHRFDGIAFVITPPYCGIDLDNIWRSDAAEPPPGAQKILDIFADTYGEASPSDTGYKIWCKARAPHSGSWTIQTPESRAGLLKPSGIEIYDHDRFFTITGRSNNVPVITDHQADVEKLVTWLDRVKARNREAERKAPRRFAKYPQELSEGERYPFLRSLCGAMIAFNACPEAIEAALVVANQMQCQDKYPLPKLQTLIQDLIKKELEK